MFEKLFLYSRNVLMLVVCTLVVACKQEADVDTINIDDVKIDTSDWTDYCIGYQSLKIPPGLKPSVHPSTNIDWQYPQIERNFQGSALDYIKGNERFGEAVFTTRVNGWDFVVSTERVDGSVVADFALVFFGAKKVDGTLISFQRDASTSLVPDVSDPKYRKFYEKLDVEPVAEQNTSTGFCYDGYVFSGYQPENIYDFTVDFLSGSVGGRFGYSLSLTQDIKPVPDDDRPLASGPTLDMFPDVLQTEQTGLVRSDVYRGYMTHIWGVGEYEGRNSIKSLLLGPQKNVKTPVVALDTIGDIQSTEYKHGEKEFLGILASLNPN
ncbi:hypothetical protein [Thalassospira marina]|uniref:Tle cognate immunity protein 4 C-terminal domain-containing protein n=1 Tax=Thalassospira marina TaxID=2048283 RepID=A0ABN5FSG4_9PROT|nr:hypothetical protein [Thalassospira marina]AUG55459.1 hypothetical protein CSC3H3_21595 [Thalassospira marina]